MGSRVARCEEDFFDCSRLGEFPGKGMLSAAGAKEEDAHRRMVGREVQEPRWNERVEFENGRDAGKYRRKGAGCGSDSCSDPSLHVKEVRPIDSGSR